MNPNNKIGNEEEQIKEVYAFFGLAIYQAQCLERSFCLLIAVNNPDSSKKTRSDYDEILEKSFQETFGHLLNNLKRIIKIPNDLATKLATARDKRNWLAHHYFWERAISFNQIKGRASMIRELSEVSHFFEELDRQVMAIINEFNQKMGITQEWINRRISDLLKNNEVA